MDYETSFVSVGETEVALCKFAGALPLGPLDCASIIIAVTDQVYYFTVERSMPDFMFCRWDGENHLNYGSVASDDPEAYKGIDRVINA